MSERTCIECGRTKPSRQVSRGLCVACYARRKRAGTLPPRPERKKSEPCIVDGCDSLAKTRGMCGKHAERVRSHGDPHVTKIIRGDELARFMAKVEQTDSCWLWQGALTYDGYGIFGVRNERTGAHRWAYRLLVGEIPNGLHLDHLCRVRNCVNPEHLEPVTLAENNRRKALDPQL